MGQALLHLICTGQSLKQQVPNFTPLLFSSSVWAYCTTEHFLTLKILHTIHFSRMAFCMQLTLYNFQNWNSVFIKLHSMSWSRLFWSLHPVMILLSLTVIALWTANSVRLPWGSKRDRLPSIVSFPCMQPTHSPWEKDRAAESGVPRNFDQEGKSLYRNWCD